MIDTLTDTNILTRSYDPAHPHHLLIRRATGRIAARKDRLVVVTQNLVEFWAVITRPTASNGLGFSVADAEKALAEVENTYPRLPDDNDSLFREWKSLVRRYGVLGKQVHDARLVAAMRVNGISQILTFNVADFTRYAGITAIHPASVLP